MTMEERLEQMEIRYTYLDDTVQSLNKTLIEKDREIVWLKKKVEHLEQMINDTVETPESEKPPHY